MSWNQLPTACAAAAWIARRRPRSVRAAGALVLLALAGALLAAGQAPASEETPPVPSLEALMRGMAGSSGVVAGFHERKEIALLSEPIETRGTLVFVPPDRLLRATTEPSRSRLVIAGERFAFLDDAGGEVVDLSSNPLARAFVENFIVLFNGDLEALRERYQPEFQAAGADWRLTLLPRHRPLSDVMVRVTLAGAGRTLQRMEMLETDGDRTLTRFEDVEVDRSFSPEELDRLFAIPGTDPAAP
ncbi:MAG: outer membrane lipoprotein carrier protein LolA [Myxococcota bacterium]